MNAREHYLEAEKFLGSVPASLDAAERINLSPDGIATTMQFIVGQAQAHALLARVALAAEGKPGWEET